MTTLQEIFGMRRPVFAHPHEHWASLEMFKAIEDAGALPVLSAALMSPQRLEAMIGLLRKTLSGPFAVQITPPQGSQVDLKALSELDQRLLTVRTKLGLPQPPRPIKVPDFDAQFDVLEKTRVSAVCTLLGGLREPYMERLDAMRIPVLGVASNLLDAKVLRASGAAAVCLNPAGAGGLVSYSECPAEGALTDSAILFEEGRRALRVPIAAGGCMVSCEQAKAARAAGLDGLYLTDALARSPQSALPDSWKAHMPYFASSWTRVNALLQGRPSRYLKTKMAEEFAAEGCAPLPYPQQRLALEDIFQAALDSADIRYGLLEISQAAYLASAQSAETIITTMANAFEQGE